MSIFNRNKNSGAFADVIRCDEPSYLIWKWHPAGSQSGTDKRENEIRWGSSLRVKDGEVAVFVYKQKEGSVQDFIVGPFDQTIKTANFPVLSSLIGLVFDSKSPFQAEVYFINLARIVQTRFAVPFFDVYDPRFTDFGVPVAVRGTISFCIEDYREFIKLHKLNTFDLEDFQKQIRDTVSRYVKDIVANAPAVHNIPVVQIETKTSMINDAVEFDLSNRLKENFGVTVSGIDIGTIEIDKSCDSYARLMAVTADMTTATVRAQTMANIRDIHDKQRIEAESYAETLRIQREEGQYAQRMQTRTANMGAYQVERQAEIGVAGAEALGRMGENGAGNVNLCDGGNGFNPVAMMASMAVGGVVGQNIAGVMGQAMNGLSAAMPPIPQKVFYVAVNGQPTGPFEQTMLQQMAVRGQITAESLVWSAGMSEWTCAGKTEELKNLFVAMPPIPGEQR